MYKPNHFEKPLQTPSRVAAKRCFLRQAKCYLVGALIADKTRD